MRTPQVDDLVRLKHDVPELLLTRGEVGVIRSTWFAPTTAYEVEFQKIGMDLQTRALLSAEQVELEAEAETALAEWDTARPNPAASSAQHSGH